MRPTAWVGCQNNARQLCRQTLWRLPTAQPITRAQEADLIRRKLTRLVNQQRVDFSALVAVDVAVAFGVSACDARAVEKLKGFAVFIPLAQRLGQVRTDEADMIGLKLCQRAPENVGL